MSRTQPLPRLSPATGRTKPIHKLDDFDEEYLPGQEPPMEEEA